jgi:hypothetical protein
MTTCNAELTFPPAPEHLRPRPQNSPQLARLLAYRCCSAPSPTAPQHRTTLATSLLRPKPHSSSE